MWYSYTLFGSTRLLSLYINAKMVEFLKKLKLISKFYLVAIFEASKD